MASLLRSTSSFAQQPVELSDEILPARWNLVQNGASIARFSRLDSLEQRVHVASSEDLFNMSGTSQVPVRHRPPSVVLHTSPNVRALTKWIEQVQTRGPAFAQKTLRLVARDADGTLLKRYQLRKAFPASVTTGPNGISVKSTTLVAARVVPVPEIQPPDDLPTNTPGPWLGLEIGGHEVARFSEMIGFDTEVEYDDPVKEPFQLNQDRQDPDKVESWRDEPSERRHLQVRFGRGRDFDEYIWKWHLLLRYGTSDEALKSGTVVQYAPDGSITAKYGFEGGYVTRFGLSERVTKARGQTLYEAVTIAVSSFTAL